MIGGVPVVATLEGHGQVIRSNLTRNRMLVGSRPPTIRNHRPRDGETVLAIGPVSVSGTFGKTAPLATIDAEVVGVASVVGKIGTAERLVSERMTADADGDFRFEIPAQMPVPGMRYEINVKASGNNESKDTRLVLFQQG